MSIFQYATIEDVREENVPINKYNDERVLEFIELASRFINLQTEQYFVPIRERHILDGNGTTSISSLDKIPIQEIKSITDTVLPAGQEIQPVDLVIPNSRSRRRREILLRPETTAGLGANPVFSNSEHNIELDGIFGWLEPRFREPITKTIAQPSSYSDKEITLNNTNKIEDHFVPMVGKETYPVISDVDNNTVKFDQKIQFPVESGDKMVFYGLTPKPIRRVCIQIAIQSANKLGSGGGQLDFTETPEFQSRVVSERTDNYSYRLAQDIPQGAIKQGDLTADIYQVLREYTVDPHYRMGAV